MPNKENKWSPEKKSDFVRTSRSEQDCSVLDNFDEQASERSSRFSESSKPSFWQMERQEYDFLPSDARASSKQAFEVNSERRDFLLPLLHWDESDIEEAQLSSSQKLEMPSPSDFFFAFSESPSEAIKPNVQKKQRVEHKQNAFWDMILGWFYQPMWSGAFVLCLSLLTFGFSELYVKHGQESLMQGREKGHSSVQGHEGAVKKQMHLKEKQVKTFRLKGGFSWQVFAFSGKKQESRKISSRGVVWHSDALRFRFSSPVSCYMMIFSVNQQGGVSLYFPYPDEKAIQVEAGDTRYPRKQAIPLNDYEGKELFWVLASMKPFSFGQFKGKIQRFFQETNGKLEKLPELSGFMWQKRQLVSLRKSVDRGKE